MKDVIAAIEREYRYYKKLAEDSIAQLHDDELHVVEKGGNSVATLMQHIGGNLRSRFKDFLTTDGEKPWRDRESEFADEKRSRSDLFTLWEEGWNELFTVLGSLDNAKLASSVMIRGVSLTVMEALARSVTHTSYHAGQIVLIARGIRGKEWKYLSIPPGGSATYKP